jgi:hypothetical protein
MSSKTDPLDRNDCEGAYTALLKIVGQLVSQCEPSILQRTQPSSRLTFPRDIGSTQLPLCIENCCGLPLLLCPT